MARRASNSEQEGNFPDPQFNFADYAQRAALAADDEDFSRTAVAFMDLAEAGRIPVEIVEIANQVRNTTRHNS